MARTLVTLGSVFSGLFVVGILVLLSAPPAVAGFPPAPALKLTAPYKSATLWAVAPRNATGPCNSTTSVLHAPTFDRFSGRTRVEIAAAVPTCNATNLRVVSISVAAGLSNETFQVTSNFTGNASVRWNVTGELRYALYNNTTSLGYILADFHVRDWISIRDVTAHRTYSTYGGTLDMHFCAGCSNGANGSFTQVFDLLNIAALRSIHFVAGDQYYLKTYLVAAISLYPPAQGPGAGDYLGGTLDLATRTHGGTLLDFKIVR
jgi:hypothetical protein